jgi:hypothetical protein
LGAARRDVFGVVRDGPELKHLETTATQTNAVMSLEDRIIRALRSDHQCDNDHEGQGERQKDERNRPIGELPQLIWSVSLPRVPGQWKPGYAAHRRCITLQSEPNVNIVLILAQAAPFLGIELYPQADGLAAWASLYGAQKQGVEFWTTTA